MSEFQRYFATDIFTDKGGVCEIKNHCGAGYGVGTTTIINAVAGKKIRVLSMYLSSTYNGNNGVDFKGTGGVFVFSRVIMPLNSSFTLSPNPYGWFDVPAGEGLQIVIGADYVFTNIRYIEVTP
jgi:hypothetical protein